MNRDLPFVNLKPVALFELCAKSWDDIVWIYIVMTDFETELCDAFS